jgi:phytoene dehydrogenase-like protein
MSPGARYDVIVVGAGVGGLTCAAFLARRGLGVLVAERSGVVGGCCSSFRVDGFHFDAAVHHVSGGGPRSLVGQALRAVGANVRFAHLNPMDSLVWPDVRFEVPGDWEALIAALTGAFPLEAVGVRAAFAELLKLYRAILGTAGPRVSLERWEESTFLEFLSAFVDDERLVRVLSGQWGYLGAPPQRLSTLGMCQMLVNYWRDGAYYPYGGTQALPDALVRAICEAGGAVRTGCGVKRIRVERERAIGIEFADGGFVPASVVVSNADVPQTVHRLLGGRIDPEYRRRIERLEPSEPFFLVYLGLDPDFRIERLPRGFYHLETTLGGPWLYVSSASEIDPSLAPPGHHALTVVVSLGGAEARTQRWPAMKEAKLRQTIARLDDYAPGLSRHVVIARAAHPPHPNRRTSSFCGSPYGWSVVPGQSGPSRLSNQTPIRNLHLAGHWSTPGPGVCAVVASGWRVANDVIEERGVPTNAALEP